jgi:hypothetical protein
MIRAHMKVGWPRQKKSFEDKRAAGADEKASFAHRRKA